MQRSRACGGASELPEALGLRRIAARLLSRKASEFKAIIRCSLGLCGRGMGPHDHLNLDCSGGTVNYSFRHSSISARGPGQVTGQERLPTEGAFILAADVRIGNAAQRTDSARRAMRS